jgi:sporulation protein YlmC with PRC-barrel domain
MSYHELHAERLLGKHVTVQGGQSIGRIEEMIVEIIDGETVVTEFPVGAGAAVERFSEFVRQLPFFGWLPRGKTYCIPWHLMDFSDPRRPSARIEVDRIQTFLLRHPTAH